MDIRTGDYVTLKSVEEVKFLYKFWDVTDNGCVNAGTNYFTNATLGIDIENSDASYQISKILYCFGDKYDGIEPLEEI